MEVVLAYVLASQCSVALLSIESYIVRRSHVFRFVCNASVCGVISAGSCTALAFALAWTSLDSHGAYGAFLVISAERPSSGLLRSLKISVCRLSKRQCYKISHEVLLLLLFNHSRCQPS